MVTISPGEVSFPLRKAHDFSWLTSIGMVFCVFAQNGSGNISFGVKNETGRYFIKAAGLKTVNAALSFEDAAASLKSSMRVSEDVHHPNLIKLIRHDAVDGLDVEIFQFRDGDCLYEHWNFEGYRRDTTLIPPAKRFRKLPAEKRLRTADILFSFLSTVAKSGYWAADFYNGSLMYDFLTDTVTIWDIGLFGPNPYMDHWGEGDWGSKRFHTPEECLHGAVIDEATNVYPLGALYSISSAPIRSGIWKTSMQKAHFAVPIQALGVE